MNEDVPMPTIVWRRKEIPNNEDCRIALTVEECKEEDEWYIDNGCSSHMTRDQNKFIILKRKGGNVAFGYDSSAKILGKGVVELGSKNVKENNFLLVEDLKHNLPSVIKYVIKDTLLRLTPENVKSEKIVDTERGVNQYQVQF